MFTLNPDGYIIFDRQLWDPLLKALDKGVPPPGTFRRKKKSRPSLSRGAAYLGKKTLAITHDFFDDEERIWQALEMRIHFSSQPAADYPFFDKCRRQIRSVSEPHGSSGSRARYLQYSPAAVHPRTPKASRYK